MISNATYTLKSEKLNGQSNGVKLNGKHFNGHGGKSATGKAIAVKSRISAKPEGRSSREISPSA